jgi:cell division transport system permease protein
VASNKKVRRRRRRFYYVTTILSITLVLFLTGLFGFVMLNVNQLIDSFKNDFQVHVLFLDDTREADIRRYSGEWEQHAGIRRAAFVHKDEAKEELILELGEDFTDFLGTNPLPHTVDLWLETEYVRSDSLVVLKNELSGAGGVKEVLYNEIVVENLERNVQVAGIILLGLAGIFLIITIALINSTIRLTMFSRRFLIKSMQLVGATRNFIRKPFMLTAIYHGFLGGFIASALLSGLVFYLYREYPQYLSLPEITELLILGAGLIIGGMLFSVISSYFAVNKYLRMRLDDLY